MRCVFFQQTANGKSVKHLFSYLVISIAILAADPIYSKESSSDKLSRLTLKRTDAIFRNASEAIIKAISNDGKQILLVNLGGAAGVPALELFDNINGKLVTRASLLVESGFPNIDDAFVDESFTTFGIVDDNGGSPATVRYRILKLVGSTFEVINHVTFDDATTVQINANISLDGRYIMTNYTTPNASPDAFSNIKLLETKTLKTLTSFQIKAYSNGPFPFVLTKNGHDKNYFVFAYSGYNVPNNSLMAPAFLQVYKVSHGKLKLVDQVEVNAFPLSYFSNNAKQCARINLAVDLDPAKNSIFNYSTLSEPFIPNEYNNVYQYLFNGKKLTLDAAMSLDRGGIASNYYKEKTFGVSQFTTGRENLHSSIGFFSFYTLDSKSKSLNKFKPVFGTFPVGIITYYGQFSKNGQYFAVSGSISETLSGEPNGINNISLFEVVCR